MILHTVNKSPLSHSCLDECLSMCASWDAVLLIEDGVYGALAPCVAIGKAGKIYALRADIAARSLSGRVDERVIIIDDREFVELATEYDKVISWY